MNRELIKDIERYESDKIGFINAPRRETDFI